MREIIFLVIIVGLFLAATAFNAYAYDNGDFQVWNTDGQEKKISEDAKITAEEEFRWGDNANQLYYHHYDLGILYSFNKNFDLSLNYRHIYERKKGKFRIENEPNINAILKWDLWALILVTVTALSTGILITKAIPGVTGIRLQ